MATPVQDDVPVLPEGLYSAPGKAEPSRTTLGYIKDLAIDVGTSALDTLATPYTAIRDTSTDPKRQAAAQLGQNVINATTDWMRSGKTEKGQWEDETGGNKSWAREALEMPITAGPALAASALTGPAAPATFAAIAVGQQGLETEKKIQDYSEKELMEGSEPYGRYRTEGMTDQEARRQLYRDMQNLETTAPTAVANVLPALGFSRLLGRMGSKTIAQSMTQRIMQNAAHDLPEGIGGGFALGAGQSYGRQSADVAGGFQDEVHYGEAFKQGLSTARTLGVVSGAGTLARSVKGPPKVRSEHTTTTQLLTEADKRKVPAPPVGEELTDVAKENLAPKPPGEERAGPGPADTEAKPPTPPPPPTTEAKPPGEEATTPPMDVTPPGTIVEPKPPVEEAPPTPPASDIRFRDADTIKARIDDLQASIKDLETQPLAEKVKPEWKEQHDQFTEEFHRLQDEHEQLTGAAVPHTPPSDEAVKAHLDITAPPEAKGLTWDQLGERVGDLEQTPTMDALNAHVKEWKEANPKTKVPDYGSLVKKWTAAKKEAKDAADAARDAQKKADLEAKKTQRAKDTEVRKAVKEDTVAREGQASTDKKVEALRQEFLEHEKKATADDLTNPEWQAKSDSLYGAWKDAEVAGRPENKQAPVKAVVEAKVEKPKSEPPKAEVKAETPPEPSKEVTPPGKPKPTFEEVAALIEPRKPKVKPGEEPPKEVETPTEPEKKPGTLTLKKRTEVEADTAAKAEAKATQEKLKKEELEKEATLRKDRERKNVKRKADQETREQAAQKIILEQKGRQHNRQAHLDELEKHMIDSKPDDAVPHMLEIAEGAHDLASNYEAELARLREGKATHDTFMMGRGKTGESRATTLGDHHSVLSDVRNYARTIQELIAKKHFLEAKDMTDRYVRMMKAVHNGEIEEVTRLRREMNDAVEMAKKTNKGGDQGDQIEAATVEAATHKQHDIISAVDDTLDEIADKSGPPSVRPGVRKPLIMKDAHGNDVLNKDGTPKLLLDKNGRMQWAPDADRALLGQVYVNGIEHKSNIGQRRMLAGAAEYEARRLGVKQLTPDQYADMLIRAGGRVGETTFGKLMDDPKMRPKDPVRGMLYDIVRKITGDMPVKIWSRDEMDAYTDHIDADTAYGWRAFYNTEMASAYFRPDTLVPNTVFHEALHAASMRAINRSARLRTLVDLIQSVVVRTMASSPTQRETLAYKLAIEHVNNKGELVRVDPHEFTSELYSRPEVSDLIKKMKLTPKELQEFTSHGYKVDMGKGLLRTWWDGLLRALNFQPARPNLYKVSIDVLGDTFDREMQHRYEDRYSGLDTHPDFRVGADYDVYHSWKNSFKEDPVPGSPEWAAREAMSKGNHPEAVRLLTEAAPRMGEKMLDGTIDYMSKVNDKYWGEDSLHNRFAPEEVTPLSTPEGIRSSFVDRIEKRFGAKAADWAWQGENKFATPIRHIMSGLKYTNDIGRNLEPMFQKVLQPLKDAWASREHFATKYMDTSGANKLIDDIATAKNQIKDRKLWGDFENLIIREGYSRTRADEELGVGANQHINTGDRRDRQSVTDWHKNRELLESIRSRNPDLITLRNRIFDFTKKELEQRHRAAARDALLSMGIVKHGDEVGLSALTKDIRRENHLMTAEERAAYDRILKVGKGSDEYKRLMIDREAAKKTHGEGSKAYSDHLAKSVKKETELLVNPKGKEYETYKKNRDDTRTIIDHEKISGPHAPFMRHGKHAVYAEFQVTPDAGVAYNEVHPEADTHTMYDFKHGKDADHFIDNVLSHPDININLRNAYDVIYDTKTGERAAHWTIEKPDGTAKTYDSREDAEAAKGEKDKITKKYTTAEDIKQMKDSGLPTDHYETRSRVVFNPKEFTKFDSERAANEYRDTLNRDTGNPNFRTKVAQVETPDSEIGRANVAYTSAEMKNWIKRKEQSPEYQRMDPDEKAEWARRMRVEAQRVTAMAGRRTAHMPREYARGASTDILKNMIDYAGSNARAMADLTHRSAIDKGLQDVEAYNDKYKNQSGFNARRLEGETPAAYKARRDEGSIAGGHRARDDAVREIKARLFAPPRVEDGWAIGVKRALQVSTISHLADTGYLIVNALEPWVFGAAISASRHGWGNTYGELADATRMVDVKSLGLMAGSEMKAAWQGKFGGTNHEQLLLDRVNSNANIRGDARGASLMLQHMFNKGLAARDVGVEAERVHDPSKNAAFRALDKVDAFFRASNAAVETLNRGILAISNYRLEYKRALKDLGIKFDAEAIRKGEASLPWHEGAHEQAMRYAEDQVFKGAGDYSAWNNPRYMRNPALKMAMQFKKYPLRIASVYFDAIARSVKGDREAQIQLAFMTIAQSVAAGAMGTPWASPAAGLVNAAYLMGITDSNWNDAEFGIRKALAPIIGVTATDTFLHGLFRFSGADFSSKMAQNSFVFFGSPESRNGGDLMKTLALVAAGAPGDVGKKFYDGVIKIEGAIGDINAGATSQGMAKGVDGLAGIMQIKQIMDLLKAGNMLMGGPQGLPKGSEASTYDAFVTGMGFSPTGIAKQLEEKRVITRAKKVESAEHNKWVNRWRDAPDSEKGAVRREIDKYNATLPDQRLKITAEDLWKAKTRQKNDAKADSTKTGVRLSGRQKAFADLGGYFDTGR